MLYRHKLLLDSIRRLELGLYTGGIDEHWCCNTIEWLWKWRKISKEEMESLCDRMVALMER